MPESPGWYFDTVVLSNFALAGRISLLVARYGSRAQVTQEVLSELSDGIAAGYQALTQAESAIAAGSLSAAAPMSVAERSEYRRLLRCLAAGEASCVACTQARGGTVVTDDRAARSVCAELGLAVTGTVGILKACCVDHQPQPDAADTVLAAMVQAGFYSPVTRISDLL